MKLLEHQKLEKMIFLRILNIQFSEGTIHTTLKTTRS